MAALTNGSVRVHSHAKLAGALLLIVTACSGAFSCASIVGIEDAKPVAQGDSGGDGSGATAGTGSGGEGSMSEDLCDVYCDAVMANCTGDFEQYKSKEVCLITCENLDPGDEGDSAGNTAECRRTYADLADLIGEPDINCPAAGPGGDGICGDNCAGLCAIIDGVCPDEYDSESDCLSDCEDVPDEGDYNTAIQSGDSVQCRLYHVGAATLAPGTHCGHTAGDTPC